MALARTSYLYTARRRLLVWLLAPLLTTALACLNSAAAGVQSTDTTGESVDNASLPTGARGFDTFDAPSFSQLRCMKAKGFSFALVNEFTGGAKPSIPWQTAVADLRSLKMDAILTQQGYLVPAFADSAQASIRGDDIVAAARSVNYPKKGQLFLDLELNLSGTTEAQQITWVETWAKTVKAAGYSAGVYIGEPQRLTATDFSRSGLPDVDVYWKSFSTASPASPQGYVVSQVSSARDTACGFAADYNTSGVDYLGNQLIGLPGAEQASPTSTSSTKPTPSSSRPVFNSTSPAQSNESRTTLASRTGTSAGADASRRSSGSPSGKAKAAAALASTGFGYLIYVMLAIMLLIIGGLLLRINRRASNGGH